MRSSCKRHGGLNDSPLSKRRTAQRCRLTPSLNFIAACNAIVSLGASPAFVDVDRASLGLCPALKIFLAENCFLNEHRQCQLKRTGAPVRALIVMHTFGHPAALTELISLTREWNIDLIEDAAESLGSFHGECHTGTLGRFRNLQLQRQ